MTKTPEEKKPRTRGTGALIHKHGSPYWYAQWWQNGRQFCVSTKETSKMKAEQSLQRFMGRKAAGLPIPEVLKLRYDQLRDSLLRHYVMQRRKSLYHPSDEEEEPRITPTKHLDAFFKHWRVTAITPDAIRKFVTERQAAGAANATINRSLSAGCTTQE
jgi:hypothetical protein